MYRVILNDSYERYVFNGVTNMEFEINETIWNELCPTIGSRSFPLRARASSGLIVGVVKVKILYEHEDTTIVLKCKLATQARVHRDPFFLSF